MILYTLQLLVIPCCIKCSTAKINYLQQLCNRYKVVYDTNCNGSSAIRAFHTFSDKSVTGFHTFRQKVLRMLAPPCGRGAIIIRASITLPYRAYLSCYLNHAAAALCIALQSLSGIRCRPGHSSQAIIAYSANMRVQVGCLAPGVQIGYDGLHHHQH